MIQTGEKSLQKVVNDRYQESVKRKDVEVPDQIIILFPTDLKTSDASTSVDDSSSSQQQQQLIQIKKPQIPVCLIV
jgi:hypothetical protein